MLVSYEPDKTHVSEGYAFSKTCKKCRKQLTATFGLTPDGEGVCAAFVTPGSLRSMRHAQRGDTLYLCFSARSDASDRHTRVLRCDSRETCVIDGASAYNDLLHRVVCTP